MNYSVKIVTKGKAELLRDKECRMHAEMSIDQLKSSNYSCCVMKRVNANDPTGCKTLQNEGARDAAFQYLS